MITGCINCDANRKIQMEHQIKFNPIRTKPLHSPQLFLNGKCSFLSREKKGEVSREKRKRVAQEEEESRRMKNLMM